MRTALLLVLLVLPLGCDKPSDPPAQAGQPLEDARASRATAPAEPPDPRRFGLAEPPPRTDGAIRLAAYNVENLFDAIDDPDLSDRYEDIDDTKPEAELAALAETIRRLDADVLALQEIESASALDGFIQAHLPGMYEHVVSIDAGDRRGIEQAVLSRFPITHVENWPRRPLGGVHPDEYGDRENWFAGEPITFHRSPLRVDIEIPSDPAYELTLFVVHQKSGRYSEYWRVAEATALAEIVTGLLASEPQRNAAILGDFNATPDQAPMRIFMEAGLSDPHAGEPGPTRVSHESGRRIDFILLSSSLTPEIVDGSAFILGTPARPVGANWRTTPPPPGYASDHYPVAIDLIPVDR